MVDLSICFDEVLMHDWVLELCSFFVVRGDGGSFFFGGDGLQ